MSDSPPWSPDAHDPSRGDPSDAWVVPFGSTVRFVDLRSSAPRPSPFELVLLVGQGLASDLWLNLLALRPLPDARRWLAQEDLAVLLPRTTRAAVSSSPGLGEGAQPGNPPAARARRGRLHVRPRTLPAFLVVYDGWPVDVFAAPLPPNGRPADARALMDEVRRRKAAYESGGVRRTVAD